MNEKPKFMTHDRIMAGEEYVSYSDYLMLQRERDEARKELKEIAEYGTEEINAAVDLRQKLASALIERDEAREEAERYRLEANAMMLQRDEAQNKLRLGKLTIISQKEEIELLRQLLIEARDK